MCYVWTQVSGRGYIGVKSLMLPLISSTLASQHSVVRFTYAKCLDKSQVLTVLGSKSNTTHKRQYVCNLI